MKSRQVIGLVAVYAALMSCGRSRPIHSDTIDFCNRENRKIPHDEVKLKILHGFYESGRKPKYISDFINNNANGDFSENNTKLLISKYITKNPYCCQIVAADFLNERIMFDSKSIREDDLKFGYVFDFVYFKKEPFYDLKGINTPKDSGKLIETKVSNCADTKIFDRG